MSFPYPEEPITEAEHEHIRQASGALYRLVEQARGTDDEDRVSEEHDAMMRLRRRHEEAEEALAAKDAEIAKLREALSQILGYDRNFYDNGRPGYEAIARAALSKAGA